MDTRGKLLVVDDEPSVRDSLIKWFREAGYEVATAENASDALTRLADQSWDAALVDIKIHAADGIELQRRMREIDPELLVILMTGDAAVKTAVAALKSGVYDYVTKPLDPDEIAHLVKKALEHKRTAHENALLRQTVAGKCKCSSQTLEDVERAHILRVVEECGGNQSHAADILDIDRVTLYHKLKKYGWTRTSSDRDKKHDEVAR